MSFDLMTADQLDEYVSRPSPTVIETVANGAGPIAVIGAGGKMGFHLCCMLQRALVAAGRDGQVIAVSRFQSSATRSRFAKADISVVSADMSDATQVATAPDAANVFFLAGVKFGTASRPDLLEQQNVRMPQLVAERYRDARIVALSTGCVYSFVTPESGGSTEESPTEAPGLYAQSCLGRERAFVEGSKRNGTPCTLIRLNYANELRYGVLVDIGSRVLANEPVNVEMGYVNVIWQGDALEHIVRSLDHADSPPMVLNVAGSETLSVRNIARMFADRMNREVRFSGSESTTAWLSNASLAHRLFGRPAVSVEEMIARITDWLISGCETLNKPTHFEVRGGEF